MMMGDMMMSDMTGTVPSGMGGDGANTWTIIGKLIFNILPSFLALTIPMAFLLAVLLGLGRLAVF